MALGIGPGNVRFSFEGFGFTQLDREFRHKGERLSDISPALRLINDDITVILREQFGSEGSTGAHGHWAELAASTVAYKRAHDQRPEILRRTGHLMGSLVDPTHEDAEFILEPHMLVRGSRVGYGPFHQRGHGSPTPLPQRRIFDFTEAHRRSMVKTIQRFLMTGEL